MGMPSDYDHPALAIFDRTLINLRHIQSKQDTAYVFEFTALVNSMLGIFVHPWDQLLNKGRLEHDTMSYTYGGTRDAPLA